MRDGLGLSADIYRPAGEGKWPAILIRTPYSSRPLSFRNEFVASSRGATWLWSWTCGDGATPGWFVPYQNEGRDGYDSVEWLAAHPLSNDNRNLGSLTLAAVSG